MREKKVRVVYGVPLYRLFHAICGDMHLLFFAGKTIIRQEFFVYLVSLSLQDMNLFHLDISTGFDITTIVLLLQVVLIDIVMSGDNALMISVTTQALKKKERYKAILFGVIGAAVLRIVFAVALSQVLEVPALKIVG